MQPVDDTDVTDRYCYFIARKSWPRILPIEGHGPSPAYLLTGVSSVALSVFPLLLSRSLFPRGASIRPPEERKEFWTNLFRLPDQEREREMQVSNSRSKEGSKTLLGKMIDWNPIVISYTYFWIVCKWLIYCEEKIVASKGYLLIHARWKQFVASTEGGPTASCEGVFHVLHCGINRNAGISFLRMIVRRGNVLIPVRLVGLQRSH